MTLQQLKYFLAAAQTGNLTAAAEQLYTSQSSVSRAIRDLEAELDCPLFTRDSRKWTLTEAGDRCRREARRILRACERLPEEVRGAEGAVSGTIRVGYVVNGQIDMLLNRAPGFLEKYPGIELKTAYGSPRETMAAFLNGDADLILIVRAEAETLENRRIFTLSRNSLYLMVPAGHPLFGRESVTLPELKGLPLVTTDAEQMPGLCRCYRELCEAAGFTPDIVGTGEKLNDIKMQMLRHRAAAFTSVETVYMRGPDLHVIPVLGEAPGTDSVAVCRREGACRALAPLLRCLAPLEDR